MSEPILERLNRFTPDAGGLDRDALLYAAGHAAARPNRLWIALAAVLVVSQALTLTLLWPHPANAPVVPVPLPSPPLEPLTPDLPDSPGLWSARPSLPETEPEDRPAPAGSFIDSEPPLRAFAPLPSPILN